MAHIHYRNMPLLFEFHIDIEPIANTVNPSLVQKRINAKKMVWFFNFSFEKCHWISLSEWHCRTHTNRFVSMVDGSRETVYEIDLQRAPFVSGNQPTPILINQSCLTLSHTINGLIPFWIAATRSIFTLCVLLSLFYLGRCDPNFSMWIWRVFGNCMHTHTDCNQVKNDFPNN